MAVAVWPGQRRQHSNSGPRLRLPWPGRGGRGGRSWLGFSGLGSPDLTDGLGRPQAFPRPETRGAVIPESTVAGRRGRAITNSGKLEGRLAGGVATVTVFVVVVVPVVAGVITIRPAHSEPTW